MIKSVKCKKIKVGVASLAFLLFGTATAFAASKGSFTFKFSTAVQGSTKFELGAVNTTCESTADTYNGHNYTSTKYNISY